MRKLNIKLLSSASALAFVVMGVAARAEVILDPALDPAYYTIISNWNEQNAEGAVHAAINAASQVAAFYGVEVGTSASPTTIEAYDTLSVEQSYWTDLSEASFYWDGGDYTGYKLFVGNGNSLSANTTIKDASVTDINQTAYTTFQTVNVDVLEGDSSLGGLTTIEIEQYIDGANTGDAVNALLDPNARDVAYSFELISRNEIDASASQQGTAIVDGLTADLSKDENGNLINPGEFINGTQLAVVTMNTIAVSAADGESVVVDLGGDSLLGLNGTDYLYGGQGFDVQGVSGGSGYWDNNSIDNEDPYTNYEQFTLEATNWAGAYAPHALTNSDPSVMNLDQKAFVTANTITVGDAVFGDGTSSEDYGTADFTIMATVGDNYDPENSGYSLGQFANFNGNENNLASTYWIDPMGPGAAEEVGVANWMSEVNVRNTAVATTVLTDYLNAAGGADVQGVDAGALAAGLDALPNHYYEGYGDVALSSIDQVASVGVNAISNIGAGELKLISGRTFDPENVDYVAGGDFVEAMDFTQSVNDFVFTNGTVSAESSFYNNDGANSYPALSDYIENEAAAPEGYINTALATTNLGDVDLNGVSQTTSFAFNSIRSVGDILGWTNLDPSNSNIYDPENPLTYLARADYDAGIVQYAETSFYVSTDNASEDALNGIDGTTQDGNVDGTDLSQVTSITANTMASNGTIIADVFQTAVGEWYIAEPNDLELRSHGEDGAITGDNISQTALYTANSITTADLSVADPVDPTADPYTPFTGGDLIAALVTQDASELAVGYWDEGGWANLNEVDFVGDTIDVGQVSQAFQISLNKVSVAGDILIGAPGDDADVSLLSQVGQTADLVVNNEIYTYNATDDVSLGADVAGDKADYVGVQAAYLNVNSISAGDTISGNDNGTLSGNVDQDINANLYEAYNTIGGYSSAGVVTVQNFTQTAAINLNTITAETYVDANIEQHINTDLDVSVENRINSISDVGSANIDGVSQQAIVRLNTIGG